MRQGRDRWLDQARAALASGDLLTAFDAAGSGLAAGGEPAPLHYVQVLALARMGEVDRAQKLYDTTLASSTQDTDTAALGARLMKDRGWRAHGAERCRMLRVAEAAYTAIFERTGEAFPAINAASLAFATGARDRAARLAEIVLAKVRDLPELDYYAAASAAEALLLLARTEEAAAQVELALALPGSDAGARSTTSRQFAKLAEAGAGAGPLIERLRPPPVMTFCGHLFTNAADGEEGIEAEIDRVLDKTGARYAYGALGCGSDIVIAERMLARGGELHVVLPFQPEEFERVSVAVGGPRWVKRYRDCLERAREVIVASEAAALGDDNQFAYGSLVSMGYARLRAGHLGTAAIQLALWDGVDTGGVAGTGADVRLWRQRGGETVVISLERERYPAPRPIGGTRTLGPQRLIRAMMFTDFAGFSRIGEDELPEFWRSVMGGAGAVIERHRANLESCNTWGDALYVVTETAVSAARIALDLQDTLTGSHVVLFGEGSGMRISIHMGAVYEATDPVTGATTCYGREVNKAARIEPVTLVGQIYVTRAFAALLEMECPGAFELAYVGHVNLAKEFGKAEMYRLAAVKSGP